MSIVITGATGRLGHATMTLLAQTGAPVHVLTRHLAKATTMFGDVAEIHEWHPQSSPPPAAAFRGAEVVINLMGEPVTGRWSKTKRQRVIDSRVGCTEKLVHALRDHRVRLVNASSFGFYPGERGENYDESSALQAPDTIVQKIIQDWERAALNARRTGNSVAVMRYGMIAGPNAYPQALVTACSRGRGVVMGDGKQTVPLVDIEDAARLPAWAATVPQVEGPVNAVAPTHVSLDDVVETIRQATGNGPRISLPGWAARYWLGPSANYTLGSYNIQPAVALRNGFEFAVPNAADIVMRALRHHGDAEPARYQAA
ncbi:MAG: NAD-dependent epimerase/dehydratase family protein [Hyphomicrobiaceae bacterium]